VASSDLEFVQCPECGNEQTDMGNGVECEECGYGPMPTKPLPEPTPKHVPKRRIAK